MVNTGSSSLKLGVLAGQGSECSVEAERHVEGWDGSNVEPLGRLLDDLPSGSSLDAVGHRVVHGGTGFREPTVVDDDVVEQLRSLAPLAPLHQERAVAGLTAARSVIPGIPHVACFDTAYHASLSPAASTYALPADWRERWPLQRFGFHGLSHAYAARQAATLVGRSGDDDLRVVTCHLGAGASLCASLGGRSVDTTMGFTPLEGLVMATRAGSVDPGLVLWLITSAGLSPSEVRHRLEHEAGLAGLAGTADMREVVERRRAGDGAASLAFDVYIHWLCRNVAAMTASLGGIDVLVFTGGVGERSSEVREAVGERLAYLEPGAVLVVEAREDLEIARQVSGLLGGPGQPGGA